MQPGRPNAAARPRGAAARPALHARPVLARGLGDRRQHRHQRRRPALPRPRRHGRPRARARGRVRRRHDRLARGHRRQRPARARDRQRGHARDRHLRARAPAAAARAPRPSSLRASRSSSSAARAPSAWCSRCPGSWPASSSTRRCCARSTTWRPGVLPMNVEAALLIEVEALDGGHRPRARGSSSQCVEEAGGSAREARSDEEIEIAWNARRSAYGALGRMHADSYTHDFATPRDRLVSSLRAAAEIADAPRSRALVGGAPRRRQPAPAAALRRARARARSSAPWRPARSCS